MGSRLQEDRALVCHSLKAPRSAGHKVNAQIVLLNFIKLYDIFSDMSQKLKKEVSQISECADPLLIEK